MIGVYIVNAHLRAGFFLSHVALDAFETSCVIPNLNLLYIFFTVIHKIMSHCNADQSET